MAKKYWLLKSEPEAYSIDDLQRDRSTLWTGIRNYQARNFMMIDMNVGDEVLFYHSNAEPPGVAGLAKISKKAQADPSAQDPKSDYYDAKASHDHPIWFCVEVKFKKKFKQLISLAELRTEKSLKKMSLLQKGQRLSVQPVTEKEFNRIVEMTLT